MSLELLFVLIMIFITNRYIFLYIIFSVASSIFLSWITSKTLKKRYEKSRDIYSNNISWLINILNGIREVKIFKAFSSITTIYKSNSKKYMDYNKSTSNLEFLISKINGVWSLIINLGLIIISFILMLKNIFTVGDYTSSAIYLDTILSMMGFYNYLSRAIPNGKVSFKRIIDLLELNDENKENSKTDSLAFDHLKVDNFSFSYENGTDVFINAFMEINKGEKIAIIGKSGTGKSTFINTMLGLNDYYTGSFRINNIEVRDINKKYLRRNISIVNQDGVLFDGLTLRENLTLGQKVPDEKILYYCKMAHIDSYILSLDKGLNTICGEDISDMSGGQKQRILLARAFIKDSPIFLLDEATSALDYETEKIIFDNFDRILSNKIVIFVSHRLSAIERMNKIYEIKNLNLIGNTNFDNKSVNSKVSEMENL